MTRVPDWLVHVRHGDSLRSALGGRLRTYRPKPNARSRLENIRWALLRGELVLNGFSRWRLQLASTPTVAWTFAEPGGTAEVSQVEIQIAEREAGQLSIGLADESTAQEMATQIESRLKRPDLLVAERDWSRLPGTCPDFRRMLEAARRQNVVTHVVAALGTSTCSDDEFECIARQRRDFERNPLLRPSAPRSGIERRFGDVLADAGLHPVPQQPVAQFLLDYAVFSSASGEPVRLDIEVDGKHWHEELPGQRKPEDERRDLILKRLGWRPVRLWTYDIERDEAGCIARIRREAASAAPQAVVNVATKEIS